MLALSTSKRSPGRPEVSPSDLTGFKVLVSTGCMIKGVDGASDFGVDLGKGMVGEL